MNHWVINWAIFLGTGAGLIWYYTSSNKHRRGPAHSVPSREVQQTLKKRNEVNKNRKKEKDSAQPREGSVDNTIKATEVKSAGSGSDSLQRKVKSSKKKGKGNDAGVSSAVEVVPTLTPVITTSKEESKDEIGDKELAQQLASLKAGSSLKAPETNALRIRTKKQSKISRQSGTSTSDTTNGADADDDCSPSDVGATSPFLHAPVKVHEAGPTTSNKMGVEDMLEAPTAGPSVLKITPPVQPQRTPQPKKPKPVVEAETKKQRQQRQKREAEKTMRAEQEKERMAKMNAHRASVRVLEGRPAKNGESWQLQQQQNAWIAKKAEESKEQESRLSSQPLLDTVHNEATDKPQQFAADTGKKSGFSPGANGTTSRVNGQSNGGSTAVTNGSNGTKSMNGNGRSAQDWRKDIPSEEEQMAWATGRDDDKEDEWQTVASKKKQPIEKRSLEKHLVGTELIDKISPKKQRTEQLLTAEERRRLQDEKDAEEVRRMEERLGDQFYVDDSDSRPSDENDDRAVPRHVKTHG